MISVTPLTREEYQSCCTQEGLQLPIEQTPLWSDFEETIPGRTFFGFYRVDAGEPEGSFLCCIAFMKYETHGFSFLRAHHGPVWKKPPTKDQEEQVVKALVRTIKETDPSIAFLRIAVEHYKELSEPVLSTVPYNETVKIDLSGPNEDAILATFKSRGRRDVRKSLRESSATFHDETDQAATDFSPYYELMVETAQRDGFAPAPQKDYENFLRILGPDHTRVYVSRVDDIIVSWSIVTLQGEEAVRYYGASINNRETRAVDKQVLEEAAALAGAGAKRYDLMGIGSDDFSPSIKPLREFKTKFAQETVFVAPDRDVPIKKTFYRVLKLVKAIQLLFLQND